MKGTYFSIVVAILDGEANAMADLCSDDALLLHPNTSLINGKDNLRDHEAKIFETVRVTILILTPVEIYGMGNLAYEVGKQEVETDQADERFLGKRKYVHILKEKRSHQTLSFGNYPVGLRLALWGLF